MRVVAEQEFDLTCADRKVRACLYAPALSDGVTWSCAFTIGAPVSARDRGRGPTSLQALVAALRAASRALYGSSAYRRKLIGGPGGDELFFPATSDLLHLAPYPF